MDDLETAAAEIRTCTLCGLHDTRSHAVPGEGPSDARILLVGEAPGRREDEEGRPFVGAAGKLLDEALGRAGLDREEVFITSILKCRPPGNRNPRTAEMVACRPHLLRQVRIVDPAVIVTLGRFGLQGLTGSPRNVAEARKDALDFEDIPVVATYHPAGAMRNRPKRMPQLIADLRRAVQLAGGGE